MRTGTHPLSWLGTTADRARLRLPGTDRAVPPEATRAMADRAAAAVGITRVADVTRLDTIGIPTFQAVRPLSTTLAVAQGKGVTAELARLSAVMESVETWHAEQPLPSEITASPREVTDRLTYDVSALAACTPSVLHDDLPLDWTPARCLTDGTPTLVPVEVVRISLEARTGWNPPVFLASTNGLASGNTLVEATLHGLYEVIERDATTAALAAGNLGTRIDPRSLGSAVADGLCALVDRADVAMEVRLLPSPTGLPCFLAWLSGHDYPGAMFGFGCHLSAEIALTRALTEAAQTRLSYIAGARDDLHDDIDEGGAKRRREPAGTAVAVTGLLPAPARPASLLDDLADVTARAAAAFGHPPLVADLSRDAIGVPVVKVVAPGARITTEVL
ncbi:YcaO-like family protein [Actinoplanes sp. NPDC051494]|uniref:YcaO-like family protein n=1 Tax=Actinoplanes sp. NPDC051494 TaxID=3363907 RepID=UPI003796CB09